MKKLLNVVCVETEARGKKAFTVINGEYYNTSLDPATYNDYKANAKHYNLFFISDEQINEGDWFIDSTSIVKCVRIELNTTGSKKPIINSLYDNQGREWFSDDAIGKIVASTDEALMKVEDEDKTEPEQMPQIPKEFIAQYVRSNGAIKTVEVEYEEIKSGWLNDDDTMLEIKTGRFQPKLTKDNEVIISSQEKLYTREEVIKLVLKINYDLHGNYLYSHRDCQKWIENNL